MYRVIIILFILFSWSSKSQDTLSFSYVNQNTYDYYLKGDWNNLIKTGKAALKNDIDYFYLRLRIGIALYNQGNYFGAEKHFLKALEFNSGDTISNYYLYQIYKNTGNGSIAALTSKKLTFSQKEYSGIPEKSPIINGVEAEVDFFDNPSFSKQTDIVAEDLPDLSKKTIIHNYTNAFVYLNHPISKRLYYSHGYTYLSLLGAELSKPPLMSIMLPPEGYVNDKQEVKQNQYYGKVSYKFFKNGLFSGGIHIISSNTINYRGRGMQAFSFNTKESNNSIFAFYKHRYSIFEASGFVAKSNLNLQSQIQGTFGISVFPAGNLNYYLLGEFTQILENDTTNRQIIKIKAGSKLFGNLWLEASHTSGEIKNYLESQGFLVYNNLNTILNRTEISLILFRPKTGLTYFLRYSQNNNLGDNLFEKLFDDAPFDPEILNNEKYKTNTFTGGIKWDF